MSVTILCESDKGGAVDLSRYHKVWASYAVASVGSQPAPEILYAGVGLPDGRSISLFVNRETGLVVVGVVDKSGRSGCEILRRNV